MNDTAAGRIAYPGLRPFLRGEFDLFFGRENCVDEMVDTLAATHFLAVLGTSGSGKSSLVRTGLLNALELGFLASAGSDWQIADLRPRGHPIRSLAVALLGLQGIAEPDEGEIEVLSSFLRRGPRSLVEWYEAGHLSEGANLLVLVDQFEELFRYQDYSGREEAEAFVALLIEAAREERLPIYVAITMRSEYLGACTLIEGLPEVINRGLYLTPRMTREECDQAIVGPAEVCGFSIEDGLVNSLLNDLTEFAPWEAETGHDQGRRLGRRADQLPLMQHVLNLLWQRARERGDQDGSIVLTLKDYEEAGALAGALDRHAEDVASHIDTADADVIDIVFRGLVTGKTVADAVRRPTSFGELVDLADGRRDAVMAVVEAFRAPGVNFLTPGRPEAITDDTIIDISHESLIRQWRRLSRCLDEEAQSAEAWSQLLSRAERYAAGTGGLLTGLDLDNQVAWWERAKPTEAWAARYGNRYAEARQFLDESRRAETERKEREAADQRRLIEAREQARSGTRFKRLSGALAVATVLVVLGAGTAVYLWLEANQQAEIATQQATIADQAREEAEQQRQEAERQSELADQERERAEQQATIANEERARAEQERVEAERAREAAEQSAETARAAQAEAAEQADLAERQREEAEQAREAAERSAEAARIAQAEAARANARLLAQQLESRVNAWHTAIDQTPADAARAGSLLARVAEAAYVADPAEATIENQAAVELLRPALALQAELARATIPAPALDLGDSSTWTDPPGGPGLTAIATWSPGSRFLRILDPIGRIVARYPLPDIATSYEQTPVAAAVIGPDIPAAVLAAIDGHLWAAFGADGTFTRYTDSIGGEIERIDDVYYDPVGARLYITYAEAFGTNQILPRLLIVERTGSGWSSWTKVVDIDLGEPAISTPRTAIAGVFADVVFVVVDGAVTAFDLGADPVVYDGLGRVADARLTVDERYIVASVVADDCFDPAAGTVANPLAAEPTCLLLVDRVDGAILWSGDAPNRMRLDQLYSIAGVDPVIEIVFSTVSNDDDAEDVAWVLNDLAVLRLARSDGMWSDTVVPFDPQAWGQEGLASGLGVLAATGTAYPTELTTRHVDRLFQARLISRLAGAFNEDETVVASRIAGDVFQVAEVVRPETEDGELGDAEISVRRYTPDVGDFTVDETLTPRAVRCPATPDQRLGSCRILAAALAPNGETLLAASNYGQHVFLGDGRAPRWIANLASDGSGRRVDTLLALVPLDTDGAAFLGRDADGAFWRIARSDTGAGTERASSAFHPIVIDDAVLQAVGDVIGFRSDPAAAVVYLWGDNGLAALTLGGPNGREALAIGVFTSNTIADVIGLGDRTLALATTDGAIEVRRIADGEVGLEHSVETGLSSFGAMSLAAANDTVVANAGDAGGYWLRSMVFTFDDNRLVPLYAVPWETLAGRLANGELVSTAFGAEVFAPSAPLPDDKVLLGLTTLRGEYRDDDAASEFRPAFEMLNARAGGAMGDDTAGACEAAIAVAARAEGGDNVTPLFDTVGRVCRGTAAGAAIADALDEENRARALALLAAADIDPYAAALLTSEIAGKAPLAADLLDRYAPWQGRILGRAVVEDVARGAPGGDVDLPTASGDPFDHWHRAAVLERGDLDPATLADALYHYARAEQLFRFAGAEIPPMVAARRAALARVLADDRVAAVFARLVAGEPGVDGSPLTPPTNDERIAALAGLSGWLDTIAATDPAAEGRPILQALVEEALADALVAGDPGRAAVHYRRVLQLLTEAPNTLSARSGLLGRIDALREVGDKLRDTGVAGADTLTAVTILALIDIDRAEPITRSTELRSIARDALRTLAAADPTTVDLTGLAALSFDFLDYDWESRQQSIVETSAVAFLDELQTAEAFLTAMINQGDVSDRSRWLALRGRVRFWMSTLEDRGFPDIDSSQFDRWLAAAIVDFEAASPVPQLPLWDRFVLGSAYAAAIDTAPLDDVLTLLDKAMEASTPTRGDPQVVDLSEYRQRLAFDGAVRALERAMVRLRADPAFAEADRLPDGDFDRARFAELASTLLELAKEREDLRVEAAARGLIGADTGWSLDALGDIHWGLTAARAGAVLGVVDGSNRPATTCDSVAAHPDDVGRTAPPVRQADIDVEAIFEACTGDTPRELFSRARALAKSDRADLNGVLALVLPAAEAGLPIAYGNLALLVRAADIDVVAPTDLLTTFSALSLAYAYPDLAALLRANQHQDVLAWLTGKAATFDVPEAHIDLAEMAPDRVTEAVHLSVAARLFEDAGRLADSDLANERLAALALADDELDAVRQRVADRERPFLVTIDEDLSREILGLS
ncbi:hypothetical protein [Bauldia sp.]|uniref:nSTAND1 domain-containing NTPase n=1 Tax=Bauldia sp. TaxID=2575872 RepID=UPI003BAD388A